MRVLASAFTCCPPGKDGFTGGESLLGWYLICQIARFNKVCVLTQEVDQITLEQTSGSFRSNITFEYIGLPKPFHFLQKIRGGHQLYYYLWQIKAYLVARKLHQSQNFDLFHHVTYANDWAASHTGALLPIPYVRGPGGGAQRTPKVFTELYGFKDRVWEKFRAWGQWLFRRDPFFIVGQNRAKAILACNPEVFNALPKKWQSKAVMFSVNGISTSDLPVIEDRRGVQKEFRIISVGKLLPIKGFQLAISTFSVLHSTYNNCKLIIVGDGPEMAGLKSMVSDAGLDENVVFTGWIPRSEVLIQMADSDVFLFPGLRDGGGEVVVEAMSMGKPVVCLNLGGPAMHITSEIGFKIDAINPEQSIKDMARALEILYLNPSLRESMGVAAKDRAITEYEWDRSGERLDDIYQKAIR